MDTEKRKNVATYMNEKEKKKLEKISEYYGCSLSTAIKFSINDKYRELYKED